jgi:hypothetical protein
MTPQNVNDGASIVCTWCAMAPCPSVLCRALVRQLCALNKQDWCCQVKTVYVVLGCSWSGGPVDQSLLADKWGAAQIVMPGSEHFDCA